MGLLVRQGPVAGGSGGQRPGRSKPWMLEWPRSALTLAAGHADIASGAGSSPWCGCFVRHVCVQPSAYRIVPTFVSVRRFRQVPTTAEAFFRAASQAVTNSGA